MRFAVAVTLAGSSVAFAEHKAFQEKYIIGCSTEQIATANSADANTERRRAGSWPLTMPTRSRGAFPNAPASHSLV